MTSVVARRRRVAMVRNAGAQLIVCVLVEGQLFVYFNIGTRQLVAIV